MKFSGSSTPTGTLRLRVIRKEEAPFSWRLRNALRWSFFWGWLTTWLAIGFSKLTGVMVATSALRLLVIKADGRRIDYGIVGRRVVTTAGVNFLVDAFQNSVEIELFNYHAIGTGSTAEAVGDTALVTELTTEYTPDNTRATGTQGEGATANIYQSVGLNTLSGAGASLREHGLMSQAATGGGTLWDRTVYALITLNDGDALQSTYEVTFTAGS